MNYALLIVVLNQCRVSIEFALSQRDVLLARSPTVRAIAVGIGYEDSRSLLCGTADALGTNEVEVTLALAAELQVTLSVDVVDRDIVQGSQAGTLTNLIHIAGSLRGTATSLQQQFGCVEQGLGVAVDALVVVLVQVLRSRTILVVV